MNERLRPIFFDLETTGVRPELDRIVEIGAYDPYREAVFQELVHPGVPIPAETTRVHGITDDMVRQAPSFAVIGRKFFEFCSGKVVLIAHNGEAFDWPFLAMECQRHHLPLPPGWSLVDSLKWARKYRKDLPKHSLQYLRDIFKIPPNCAHRALEDVMTLYRVFSLMTDDLTAEELVEYGEGMEITAEQRSVTKPFEIQPELWGSTVESPPLGISQPVFR